MTSRFLGLSMCGSPAYVSGSEGFCCYRALCLNALVSWDAQTSVFERNVFHVIYFWIASASRQHITTAS